MFYPAAHQTLWPCWSTHTLILHDAQKARRLQPLLQWTLTCTLPIAVQTQSSKDLLCFATYSSSSDWAASTLHFSQAQRKTTRHVKMLETFTICLDCKESSRSFSNFLFCLSFISIFRSWLCLILPACYVIAAESPSLLIFRLSLRQLP